jgi:hypothetical protein
VVTIGSSAQLPGRPGAVVVGPGTVVEVVSEVVVDGRVVVVVVVVVEVAAVAVDVVLDASSGLHAAVASTTATRARLMAST